MYTPTFSYYKIDSNDIWEYERDLYLNNNSDDKTISRVKELFEAKIILQQPEDERRIQAMNEHEEDGIHWSEKVDWENIPDEMTQEKAKDRDRIYGIKPFSSISDSGTKDPSAYYLRHRRELLEAKTLKDFVRLNFFSLKSDFYSYGFHLIIDRDDEDFDFWFVLKLRQYSERLVFIDNFLNYQLDYSFDGQRKKFIAFLEIILLQYSEQFLMGPLNMMVSQWIKSQIVAEDEQIGSGIEPAEDEIEPVIVRTFYSSIIDDLNERASENNFLIQFSTFCRSLRNEGFISSKAKSGQLLKFFTEKELTDEDLIEWTGTPYALREFANILANSNLKIGLKGRRRYESARYCFVLKLRDMKEYGRVVKVSSIQKAYSSNSDNLSALAEICEKFVLDVSISK